ncbi:MAG: hypothetical protein AABW51_03035 [Nanoarchaeota archaeon]
MKHLDNQTPADSNKEKSSENDNSNTFVMLDDYFVEGDCMDIRDSEQAYQRYKAKEKNKKNLY